MWTDELAVFEAQVRANRFTKVFFVLIFVFDVQLPLPSPAISFLFCFCTFLSHALLLPGLFRTLEMEPLALRRSSTMTMGESAQPFLQLVLMQKLWQG